MINWFHQGDNKESRIITKAATVKQTIVFPDDWHLRWPEFFNDVVKFKRKFSANTHDDAPDVLTGIVERKNFVPSSSMAMSAQDL